MPSNRREPISRWVSCGIMVVSRLPVDKKRLTGQDLAEMPKAPRFSPNGSSRDSGRVVEVLTFPAVQLLDVTGPIQVFASANDLIADAGGAPPYQLKLVTESDKGVMSSAGPPPRRRAPPPPPRAPRPSPPS